MIRVNTNLDDFKTLLDALKGDYGASTASNGVKMLHFGPIALFWGAFDSTAEVVEVPSLPVRYPVLFASEKAAASVVVEERTGFSKVPDEIKGKKFTIMGFALLNT